MAKERRGFLTAAYGLKTPQDNITHYDGWAETYDEYMEEYRYVAPAKAAALLAKRLPQTAGEIIDLGCGTGLAGAALKAHGDFVIDGADISPNMVACAAAKNIYRNLQTADILRGLNFADDSYDAGVSVGTFTIGHVGPEGLPELMRIVKPGGIIALTVNEMVYEKEKYPEKLGEWEKAQKIAVLDCFKDSYIAETNTGGFYIAFRVL